MFKSFTLARIAGLLAAAALLAACSPPAEDDSRSPEEIVAEREQAWWQAHIDKDYGAAWELATPGYRQATSRDMFIENRSVENFKFLDVELRTIDCEEKLCETVTDVSYRPVGAPPPMSRAEMKTTSQAKWLNIDGQWWRSVSQ